MKVKLYFIFFLFLSVCGLKAQNLFPNFKSPIKYPAITPDGTYMVFIAEEGNAGVAYESFFKDGIWTDPQKFDYINRLIEKTGHEVGGFNFSHDASMLLFHANMTGNYDVFYAVKKGGLWGEPVSFGAPVNTNVDEFSPTISANMKMLIVLRNTPTKKTLICKEMLFFEKDRNGNWKGPAYMPAEFNIGCQETPFIAADNVTLFFSSMREDLTAQGKNTDANVFNIYHAQVCNDILWTWMLPSYMDELNELYPKNNNLSPITNSSGDFFVYNVKAPKLKNPPQNIIKKELPTGKKPGATQVISGTITDRFTKEPLIADIIVYDAITSAELERYKSTDDGRYSIILFHGANYKIDFTSDNYSHTYYFTDLSKLERSGRDEFHASLFNAVNLGLNIYDNELFFPLTPKVSVFESTTGSAVLTNIKPESDGKFNFRLNIGQNYRIHVEGDNFDPYETQFDLQTPVFYSDFGKSIELKSTRKLVVLDLGDVDLKNAIIVARNLNKNELITEVVEDSQGRYVMSLRIGDTYEIDVTKTGYSFFNTTVDVSTSEEEIIEVMIEELTTETKIVLNHITFETNSAELNATSYQELGRVLKLMMDNPEIRIEIAAHTDDVGKDAFNMLLSDRRAKSVVDYLTSRGIAISRLNAKGYGKTQPFVPNISDENRALNRRVEMRIIE